MVRTLRDARVGPYAWVRVSRASVTLGASSASISPCHCETLSLMACTRIYPILSRKAMVPCGVDAVRDGVCSKACNRHYQQGLSFVVGDKE